MEKISYDLNYVVSRLAAKVANLEVQLAHEQTANEVHVARVQELEKELKKKTNAE